MNASPGGRRGAIGAPILIYASFPLLQLAVCVWGWVALPDELLLAGLGTTRAMLPAPNAATLTPLGDGQFLLVGGTRETQRLNDAARYDLAADRWLSSAPLPTPRAFHSATRLRDGRVLVVGGDTTDGKPLDTADIYDPATDRWSQAGLVGSPRQWPASILLADGRVLVVGGEGGRYSGALRSAELYDPVTNGWRPTTPPTHGHRNQMLLLLADGRILLLGNAENASHPATAEIYDPFADRWSPAATPNVFRSFYQAVLLRDGRVLVAGGSFDIAHSMSTETRVLEGAEVYDPATDRWTNVGSLKIARYGHSLTLLADGTVMAAGGTASGERLLSSAERFDPTTGRWNKSSAMPTRRTYHLAFLLPTGNLVVMAGQSNAASGRAAVAASYDSATRHWSAGVGTAASPSIAATPILALGISRTPAIVISSSRPTFAGPQPGMTATAVSKLATQEGIFRAPVLPLPTTTPAAQPPPTAARLPLIGATASVPTPSVIPSPAVAQQSSLALWWEGGRLLLLTASVNRAVAGDSARIWDQHGLLVATLPLPADIGMVVNASLSPDHTLLALGSVREPEGGLITIWRLQTLGVESPALILRPTVVYPDGMSRPNGVPMMAWTPDSATLTTALGELIRSWDAEGRPLPNSIARLPRVQDRTPSLVALAWSPDGTRLIIAASDGTAVIVPRTTVGLPVRTDADRRPVTSLTTHNSAWWEVAWSPDGRVVAARDGSEIRFWQADGTPLAAYQPANQNAKVLTWNPLGTAYLLQQTTQGGLIISLDTQGGAARATALPTGVTIVLAAWSADGRDLAISDGRGQRWIWRP